MEVRRKFFLLRLGLRGVACFFAISLFFLKIDTVGAAAITWDGGGGDGKWETATNWSGDTLPTSADQVTINPVGASTVTLSSGQFADFNTLTVGGGGVGQELVLEGNIGTGGSITVSTTGIITQKNSVPQTLSGTLTVGNGGILRHEDNSTAQSYVLNFSANNVTINSGGSVNVDGRGYDGGNASAGSGPGGGVNVLFDSAGGGGHGGNGGKASTANDGSGGAAYCNITNLATMGSGGASATFSRTNGDGGGLVILNATSTMTINGTISARGNDGVGNSFHAGGSGGGIRLSAGTVAGSALSINVGGGEAGGSSAGGGAGGCVQLIYTVSNSIASSTVSLKGGGNSDTTVGVLQGGAGQFFIKRTIDTYGDLYVTNTTTPPVAVASTTQTVSSLTLKTLSLWGANYVVTTSYSLTLASDNSNPLGASTNTSTLSILGTLTLNSDQINGGVTIGVFNGGTFVNSSTLQISTNSGLRINNGGTLTSTLTSLTSSGNLYLTRGGTFAINALTINGGVTTLNNYTTSTPRLELTTFILNGGTLQHEDNSTVSALVNIVNISATNITIGASGTINVDGRGYDGGAPNSTGEGPGGGIPINFVGAGGGGHGGAGGAGSGGSTGGSAYCNISNVNSLGSGGASGSGNKGDGAGGGLIKLHATSTLTINGTLSARGLNAFGNIYFGGGAGGGIQLSAAVIAGTPTSINVAGGNDGSSGVTSGGGGGGCVQVSYRTSNSITTSTINGGTGLNNGQTGLFSTSQSNATPTTTSITPSQTSSTTVQFSTTISDSDLDVTTLKVHYSTDGSTWVSSTLGTVSASSGTVTTTETGRIGSIDTDTGSITLTIPWAASTDLPETDDTTVYIRVIPNDGVIDGAAVTSSAFALDTKKPTQMGNISVSSTTATAVTIGLPTTTSTDTNFLEYKIYYNTTSPVTTASSAFTSSTDSDLGNNNFNGTNSTTISSLSPNTTYYFKLFAFDTWGNRTSSVTEVSTTTQASVPSSVSATANSQTQITLSWSGDGTDYYAENTTASTNSGWQSATSYAFTGLTCGTSYTFQVKARNSALIESSFSSTASASTNACDSNNGGGGGGGGGGFGSPPPITPSPNPTSTSSNPNGNLTFPDDFYFFPWMRPGGGNTEAPPYIPPDIPSTDLGIPEHPGSAVGLTKLPKNVSKGGAITFTYSFKNNTAKRQTYKITRTIIREEDQKTVLTSPGTRTLNPKQSFSYAPKDTLTNLYTPGIYQVMITVYDSTGKKQLDQNGFKFEVVEQESTTPEAGSHYSLVLNFNRVPTEPLSINKYLTFTYSFKNTSNKKQTFRILREIVSKNTGKTILSSKGYRTLGVGQITSYAPKDKITNVFTYGSYLVRVKVFDNAWKNIIDEQYFEIEVN